MRGDSTASTCSLNQVGASKDYSLAWALFSEPYRFLTSYLSGISVALPLLAAPHTTSTSSCLPWPLPSQGPAGCHVIYP